MSYNVGEQELLLMSLESEPLPVKYSGPGIVEKMFGEIDYVMCTLDRRKFRGSVTQISNPGVLIMLI